MENMENDYPKTIIFDSNNTFLDLQEEDNLSIVDKTAGPNV